MRKLWLLGAFLALALSIVVQRPAQAAETFYVSFDGDEGDLSFTIDEGTLGTGELGLGAVDTSMEDYGFGPAWLVQVTIALPEGCAVSHYEYRFYTEKQANLDIGFWHAFDGGDNVDFPGPYAQNVWNGQNYDFPEPVPAETLELGVAYADGEGVTDGEAAIDEVAITCDDYTPVVERVKPLSAGDEHEQWGMYDGEYASGLDGDSVVEFPNAFAVFAFANTPNANVSAVAPGTVLSVRPFSPALDCSQAIQTLYLCFNIIPQIITQEVDPFAFGWEPTNESIITIQDDDDPDLIYTYYVQFAKVSNGDRVVAGCILGQTIQMKNLTPAAVEDVNVGLDISPNGSGLSIGATIKPIALLLDTGFTVITLKDDGEPVSLFPTLTLPPDQSNCKSQVLSGCLTADPDLGRLDKWIVDDGVSLLPGGGVSLPVDHRIVQQAILVDPEVTYSLNVQARSNGPGGDDDLSKLKLTVGYESEVFAVSANWNNYSFTVTGEDWLTVADMTDISVSNGGEQGPFATEIEVRYICLAPDTTGTAPGSCYFANSEFDSDGSAWTVSNTTFASGQAYMVDGSTITQAAITLKPDDESTPHTYTIRAGVRLLATTAYTGQVGKSVALEYQYPTTESYAQVGEVDSAAVVANGLNLVTGAVVLDYPYVLSTTLEVDEDISSAFSFRVDVTDADNYILGLRLDYVCIDPDTDDGTFPGQDGGGGYSPPFIASCSTVPIPQEGSIAAWTYYHWSQLNRFFKCDLMKLLNQWFKLFDSFRKTVLSVMRWFIALIHYTADWMRSVFYWLDGHFRNMAVGSVTIINEGGDGCGGNIICIIGDVLNSLISSLNPIMESLANVVNVLAGVLIGAVNLFVVLITGIVGIVLALAQRLFYFLQTGVSVFNTLVTAYNTATPTAIPGLPMCATDPSSSLICTGIWTLDNTIFAGRWGVLMNVILAIASIHLLLWVVGELKRVMLQTWGSS